MRAPHKLARRLFSRVLLGYLLLALVLSGLQFAIQYASTRQAIAEEIKYLGQAFSPSLGEALWALDQRQIADMANGLLHSPVITGVSIRDEHGNAIVNAGEIDALALRSGLPPLRIPLSHSNPEGLAIETGELLLHAGRNVILAQLQYGLLATLLSSFIMAGALWLMFYWVIHRELSRPLAAVTAQLRQWRGDENLGRELPPYPHRDELGDLLQALGHARQRLDSSLQALNELNASLEDKVSSRTRELSAAKQSLELSLAGGRLGCWEWDLASGRNQFDARWAEMLGYSAEEIAPHLDAFTRLIHPEDLPRLLTAARELTEGLRGQYRVDLRMRAKDGEYRWIQSCGEITQRASDGQPLRLSGTHQDITERKQAEHSLLEAHAENARILADANLALSQRVAERTQELEAANQSLRSTLAQLESTHLQLAQSEKLATLGKLVALFAHDISNPISNSWMASGILDENLSSVRRKQDDGTLRQRDLNDFLDTVAQVRQLLERNLERAHELLESFKDMALDQATSMRRTIILKPWLEQLAYTLSPMFKGRAVQLELDVPATLELDTRPGPLAQVLTNLIGNALIHAFPPQASGKISIRTRTLDKGRISLQVCDDGCGMSRELQTRIFEAFFTTRPGQGGTGLGLDIVRSIVEEQLEGRVEVHSAPGQGSRFELLL